MELDTWPASRGLCRGRGLEPGWDQAWPPVAGQPCAIPSPPPPAFSDWWSLDSSFGQLRSIRVSLKVMQVLTGLETVPPGMLAAVAALPKLPAGCPEEQAPRQLVLDGVQDPGNEVCRWGSEVRMRDS